MNRINMKKSNLVVVSLLGYALCLTPLASAEVNRLALTSVTSAKIDTVATVTNTALKADQLLVGDVKVALKKDVTEIPVQIDRKLIVSNEKLPSMSGISRKQFEMAEKVSTDAQKKALVSAKTPESVMLPLRSIKAETVRYASLQTPREDSLLSKKDLEGREESYLHLAVNIDKNGGVKVLSAVEVKGKLRPSESVLGDYIIGLEASGESIAVQAVQDPFVLRAFPESSGDKHDEGSHGHHFSKVKDANIVIKVPNFTKAVSLLDQLELKLFKLSEGPEINRINPRVFKQLLDEYRLETIIEVPVDRFSGDIKEQLELRKVEQPGTL